MQKTNGKLRYIIILIGLVLSSSALGKTGFAKVGRTPLYYEYYPNNSAEFKGTIIFQNGSGTPLSEWTQNKEFFNCIRKLGNVFLYDRSGLGKSPNDLSLSTKKPMTAKKINDQLIGLLHQVKVKPPFVIVSHSYGGIYSGYFARKYPNLTAGMVMVDPVPRNYTWSDKIFAAYNTSKQQFEQMKSLSSKQLYDKYSYDNANKYNTLPAQLFYQLLGFNETKKQIANLPPTNNKIPIAIISSTYMQKNAPIEGDWFKQQKQWLTKNKNSTALQVKSGHFIQLDNPNLVCKQINRIVTAVVNQG